MMALGRRWLPLYALLAACHGGSGGDVADLSAPILPDLQAPRTDLAEVDLTLGTPYASPGSATFTTTKVTASLAGSEYPITLYVPYTPGPRPVVVLSPGYGQVGEAYSPYAERLASFGIVVLLRDDPGLFTGSTGEADQLTDEVAIFLPAQNSKSGGPLEGRVDLTKVGLMGHSRGGQVSLIAATGGLLGKVVAYFGLDPVDAAQSGTMVRGAVPMLAVPSAFLGETLDGTSILGAFGMACAPTADNYAVLYAQAPSPSLLLTAIGAAHFDFERGDKASGATLCQTGTAGAAKVLDMAVTLSTGFFARELLGQPVGAGLEGAGVDSYIQSGQLTRSQK